MRLLTLLTLSIALIAQSPAITDTQWRLKKIGDQAVASGKGQKKPYLKLEAKDHKDRRVVGFSGCNRLSGSYKLEGKELSFSPIAATKMACAEGMEIEKLFTQALARVKSYKIAGQSLTLLDDSGKVLAQLEAVAKKTPAEKAK